MISAHNRGFKHLEYAIRILVFTFVIVFGPVLSAGAEGSSTTSSGSATLEYAECSVAITSDVADFGIWTWDGYRYYGGSDSVVVRIHLRLTGGGPAGCDVTIQSDGFWLKGQPKVGTPAIGPEYLAVWQIVSPPNAWGWTYMDDAGSITIPGLKPEYDDYVSVGIGLMGVPNTLMPGEYETTFILTVVGPDSAP